MIPSAPASLLVTEPFDYRPGTYAAGIWSASGTLGGSGVGLWINPDITPGEAGLPGPDLSVSYRAFTDNRNLGGINLSPGAVKMDEILFGGSWPRRARAGCGAKRNARNWERERALKGRRIPAQGK